MLYQMLELEDLPVAVTAGQEWVDVEFELRDRDNEILVSGRGLRVVKGFTIHDKQDIHRALASGCLQLIGPPERPHINDVLSEAMSALEERADGILDKINVLPKMLENSVEREGLQQRLYYTVRCRKELSRLIDDPRLA